ncbi:tRNA lysidine(34) synthetase TilS [Mesobaculum littorinae]|uniref:tRNA(Ile)-lysidine synthase n=2 Tax=Mesobaculum littorinae TaxID=2486419 RepID=A0A438AKG5_9RHOB|nr:tRNA lysidine(34) synthetase TilS [Mesobaculum littorinae]
MALLHMLSDWAGEAGVRLSVATVDHGLRAESAEEATGVARAAARLGHDHTTLTWRERPPGNLQDAARRARYALLADWARQRGLSDIALGHTRDDLAETLLMRLSRKAGVDGLAGMAPEFDRDGARFHRPLLFAGRADLRQWLRDRGVDWVDDPSNDDPAYLRSRARHALRDLSPLGIDAAGLAQTARHMAEARDTLRAVTAEIFGAIGRTEAGDVILDFAGLARTPDGIQRRVLRGAIGWIAGGDYGPRETALDHARAALAGQGAATLGGVLMRIRGDELRLTREYAAVAGCTATPGAIWDGRWLLRASDGAPGGVGDTTGMAIRALGPAGLRQCPTWRAAGIPRETVLAAPAVWCENVVIAAPLAGLGTAWRAVLAKNRDDFTAYLLSH